VFASLSYPSLFSLGPSAHAVETLVCWRSVPESPRGSVRRPPRFHWEITSHEGIHLAPRIASTKRQTAKTKCQNSSSMTVPADQRSKRLPELPNDPLSLPAHFANLYLPILQHNVSVEVHHGGCRRNALRKRGLGIDHDCEGDLESQRIKIAGTCDVFLNHGRTLGR
jgi:hypothetical protein